MHPARPGSAKSDEQYGYAFFQCSALMIFDNRTISTGTEHPMNGKHLHHTSITAVHELSPRGFDVVGVVGGIYLLRGQGSGNLCCKEF